jgi:hypothetical protein
MRSSSCGLLSMFDIVVQASSGDRLSSSHHTAGRHFVFRTHVSDDRQANIAPELTLGSKTMWGVYRRNNESTAYWSHLRNRSQQTHGSVSLTFGQHRLLRFPPHCNRRLKEVFISAATGGSLHEPYKPFLERLKQNGMRAEMARLTLARKIAAVVLIVWKKGVAFDPTKLNCTT